MALDLTGWTPPDTGALFVVSGASGTGKTTLVKQALSHIPSLGWSVSATTRAPREGETNGEDYHFLSRDRFEELHADGAFLEWAEVYGNYYGTLRGPVDEALNTGTSILLEIDVQGARQVRTAMPEAVLVFVLPPSFEALEERLRGRSSEDEGTIQRRLRDAQEQLDGAGEFDILVVNDDLESGHAQFQGALVTVLNQRSRRPSLVRRFRS